MGGRGLSVTKRRSNANICNRGVFGVGRMHCCLVSSFGLLVFS